MNFKNCVKIVAVSFLLCYLSTAFSQQLQFEKFTTANGLQTDRVYTLRMDHKGYIWACTNYGIAKFNGNNFIPVCTNLPFREHFAMTMFEDPKGKMWFANSAGHIYTIKNDSAFYSEGFEKLTSEFDKNAFFINNLLVDDAQNVFFTTSKHTYKLTYENGYQLDDLTERYKNDSADFIIFRNKQASLFIKKYPEPFPVRNIFKYKILDQEHLTEIHTVEINSKAEVRLAHQQGKTLFLTAANELIKISPSGITTSLTFKNSILSITSDNAGNIWLGMYQDGLYKISAEGKIIDQYFTGTSINDILFDDQNGLWVSTAGRGIYHCKNIHNNVFLNDESLIHSVAMIRKVGSNLYAGTFDGKVFQIGQSGIPQKIDLKEKTKSMISDVIRAENGYYIISKDVIMKTDTSFDNIRLVMTTDNKNAGGLGMEYDTNGNLFVLTRTSILQIENERCKKMAALPGKAYSFISYKDGVLVATSKGLSIFSNGRISTPPYLAVFDSIIVERLCKSPNGNIWACTAGNGFICLQPDNKIVKYPEIPGDVVHDLFFVNDTTIVLCLNTGIYFTFLSKLKNPDTWYQLYNAEATAPEVINNKLYAATNSGLLSFELENNDQKNNSKLYFKKAIADDRVYSDLPLTFEHNQNKIEFYFDLLDYKMNRPQIFYILEGASSEKGVVEGTKITTGKLAPGKYILSVYYGTQSIHLPNGCIITFNIEPAFWQTMWFQLSTFFFVIASLILIIYLINRKTKLKERQKAKVTRLLAEYKLTALKAQINPHFISNSLSAIQQLIIGGDSEKAGQYLAKFSLLIRHVLKYSDKSIVTLSEELEVIDLNIQLESLRFKDNFDIQKHIDKNINPEEIAVPPLITQPFIENAIWHGLLPLKGKRKPRLSISISKIKEDLLICIEDNGVGRDFKKEVRRESQGTKLISNRLENINLMLNTTSAMLRTDDLINESGEAIGTRVNIIIPAKLNATEYD